MLSKPDPNIIVHEIVEEAFAEQDFTPMQMRDAIKIKSVTIDMLKAAFWAGYREAQRDMVKE